MPKQLLLPYIFMFNIDINTYFFIFLLTNRQGTETSDEVNQNHKCKHHNT